MVLCSFPATPNTNFHQSLQCTLPYTRTCSTPSSLNSVHAYRGPVHSARALHTLIYTHRRHALAINEGFREAAVAAISSYSSDTFWWRGSRSAWQSLNTMTRAPGRHEETAMLREGAGDQPLKASDTSSMQLFMAHTARGHGMYHDAQRRGTGYHNL